MNKRLNYYEVAPRAVEILLEQEKYLKEQFKRSNTLTTTIWELVKLRVSQLNQCAFCIDMHSKDALHLGEKPERIYGLDAWRDMPFYTEQEKSALEFAELLSSTRPVVEGSYQRILDCFGEEGLVNLTIAINAINMPK